MNISSLQEFYSGFYIDKPCGNNAFSYEERSCKKIFVPSMVKGDMSDIALGDRVVFADVVDGVEKSVCGLKQFVHIEHQGKDIFIVDNHNHAFSCWAAGIEAGVIVPGSKLVHVDQHKDMREPSADCLLSEAVDKVWGIPLADIKSRERAWCLADRRDERARLLSAGASAGTRQAIGKRDASNLVKTASVYANEVLNVGNFISPALKLGWFKDVIQVGSQEAFEKDIEPPFVLDIDLDIFALIMDYIPKDYKIARLRYWMAQASFITMATSPFFMDQAKALKILEEILSS